MYRSWMMLALVLCASAIVRPAHAVPTCTRVPGATTEVSVSGTRQFPLSGPCHTLALAPPPGVPVVGFMMIVAAGGWNSNPQAVRDFHNRHAQRFANDGFLTYTIEHTPGTGTALGPMSGHVGFQNVVQHYDELRAAVDTFPNGSAYPICAFGESSGGNSALLLGISRPALHCIIAQAPPTDLRTVSSSMPAVVRQLAINAFGETNLAVYSPLAWPASTYLKQKILLGHGYGDQLVGRAQSLDFCASRVPTAKCYILDTSNGSVPWSHVLVTPSANNTFLAFQQLFAP